MWPNVASRSLSGDCRNSTFRHFGINPQMWPKCGLWRFVWDFNLQELSIPNVANMWQLGIMARVRVKVRVM